MTRRHGPQHGFTAVDRQAEPQRWIEVLDRLRREPFYAAYKERTLALLDPCAGGRYLDVGAGTGDDARALAARAPCVVVAMDSSFTMASACRDRGGVETLVADATHLPFRAGSFDGCRADRVFQHLSNPERTLAEIVRVTRSGGRVVAVDPDYDTQVLELSDRELARRVLRFRADRMLRNGTIAHRMAAAFSDAGLGSIGVEPMTLAVSDPRAVDNVMGLRTWAKTAARYGAVTREEAERWERLLDETIRAEKFFYSVAFFITLGTKP
jgi:SAM-dependent methyltransferase